MGIDIDMHGVTLHTPTHGLSHTCFSPVRLGASGSCSGRGTRGSRERLSGPLSLLALLAHQLVPSRREHPSQQRQRALAVHALQAPSEPQALFTQPDPAPSLTLFSVAPVRSFYLCLARTRPTFALPVSLPLSQVWFPLSAIGACRVTVASLRLADCWLPSLHRFLPIRPPRWLASRTDVSMPFVPAGSSSQRGLERHELPSLHCDSS